MVNIINGTDEGDYIVGTAGADSIDAGGAKDVVKAGEGGDYVDGGANRDRLYGEEGNDTMNGGGSDDKVYGGAGEDVLLGGGQNDRVYGGDDSDTIIGGADDDVLYGDNPDGNDDEGWADTFVFDSDDGNDKVFDFESGLDTIDLIDGGSYTLTNDGNNSYLTYGSTTVIFYDEILVDADINVITADVADYL